MGGVYGEIQRLQQLVDEFHKHPNATTQYQKATEFAQLAKRRIENELYSEPHYRNFDFLIRLVKCFALLWKSSEPLDSVRLYIIEQGVLDSIMALLADTSSSYALKYTIAGLLRLLSTYKPFHHWLALGNGIRSIFQVLSHYYEATSSTARGIAEYRDCISFLLQVLLSLSVSGEFIQSLFHILRFHRISDVYNLPMILKKVIEFHHEHQILRVTLK